MITREGYKRVLKAIEVVAAAPKEKFDMDSWGTHAAHDDNSSLLKGDITKKQLTTLCGTTACAAGWCAADPYFRRRGLTMKWSSPYYKGEHQFAAISVVHKGNDKSIESTLGAFFGISTENSDILFGGDNDDASGKAWAIRIKKWLDTQTVIHPHEECDARMAGLIE